MKTILSITIFAIQIATFIPLCACAEDAQLGKGQYDISCEGTRVTVHANDANAAQLLQDFSKKSGITFNKYVGKRETVTLDLNGVTAEEFLNKVLGSYVATSKKKNGATQISKVTVMDEAEDTAPPPRAQEGSKEKPRRPSRKTRSSWRKKRSARSSRRRDPNEQRPPKPPDQPSEGAADEPQPPAPPEQPPGDPSHLPPSQESEEQPEEQPEL